MFSSVKPISVMIALGYFEKLINLFDRLSYPVATTCILGMNDFNKIAQDAPSKS